MYNTREVAELLSKNDLEGLIRPAVLDCVNKNTGYLGTAIFVQSKPFNFE